MIIKNSKQNSWRMLENQWGYYSGLFGGEKATKIQKINVWSSETKIPLFTEVTSEFFTYLHSES